MDAVGWFMLGCVAFSVYCHAGSAQKSKMGGVRVLKTGLDLAAGALCIEWGLRESYMRVI